MDSVIKGIAVGILALILGIAFWPVWNYCLVPAFVGIRPIGWAQSCGMVLVGLVAVWVIRIVWEAK